MKAEKSPMPFPFFADFSPASESKKTLKNFPRNAALSVVVRTIEQLSCQMCVRAFERNAKSHDHTFSSFLCLFKRIAGKWTHESPLSRVHPTYEVSMRTAKIELHGKKITRQRCHPRWFGDFFCSCFRKVQDMIMMKWSRGRGRIFI